MNFPFSAYDFFGYLVAGFIVIGAMEHALGANWLFGQELKLTTAAFWVGASYILGHVIAHLSSFFIEHCFLRRVVGFPTELLFAEPETPDTLTAKKRRRGNGLKGRLFPVYCKPLPRETKERVLEKSTVQGFTKPNEALFYHCHAIVKRDKIAYERMTSFLNQYGFCRNVCMASLLSAPILLFGALRNFRSEGVNYDRLGWSVAAIGVSIVMLYRYMKFFRHYSTEVFLTYAEFKESDAKSESK